MDIHLFFLKLLLNDILLSVTLKQDFRAFFKFIVNMLKIKGDRQLLRESIDFVKIIGFLIKLFMSSSMFELNDQEMNQNLFSTLEILIQLFRIFKSTCVKIAEEWDLPKFLLEQCLFKIPSQTQSRGKRGAKCKTS